MKAFIRSPLFWILLLALALRLAGIAWGLPASDGWDDDGFAPRNFLTALALTWTPGSFFTYPPLHAILLALPSLPVAGLAIAHAHSLAKADVIGEITKPVYMTYFAVVARLISVAMSLAIIVTLARMTQLLAGRRAGLFAALAAALCVTFTYYSQVTNLDVPYLFWSLLALYAAMRAAALGETISLIWAALFAAAAVATKDQAYAVFLLSAPAFLLIWIGCDPIARRNAPKILRTLVVGCLIAALLFLTVDGVLGNAAGFLHRVAFLTGPANRDFATYANDWAGRWNLLRDVWDMAMDGHAAIAILLALLGFWFHLSHREDRPRWVAGLLPALALLSFTLCFNLVALRTDVRFLLPQALLACIYIGVAADRLAALPRLWPRGIAMGILIVTGLFALYWCIGVSAAFVTDPRYDAEAWMAAHVQSGDTIETYGQNAYLPRFPAQASVQRVGKTPLAARNPLPGVTEVFAPFDQPRTPRFIVISGWWERHYLDPRAALGGHRVPSPAEQAQFQDKDGHDYFTALESGRLPYRLVHVSRYAGGIFPPVHIHESLNEPIRIFARQ